MIKSISGVNVQNKRILVRCDFNVPLDDGGNILDDFKIRKSLPTINYLIENNAKVILMSHLGKPEGKFVETLALDKVNIRLEKLLRFAVKKTADCIGVETESKVNNLKPGEALLLENLRFHKGEEENSEEFAKEISKLGEIYVNDAFAECHRPYASMVSVPKYLPHYAGLLLETEVENLNKILKNPARPVVALVGGAKPETKVAFIEKISETVDFVIVNSLIKKEIDDKNIKFKFPEKIVFPEGDMDLLDINKETIKIFKGKILSAKTVFWNGPFGKFEDEKYQKGTLEVAKAIIKSKAFSVVGGGETIEFLDKESILDKFSHISTGGGAMLEFLSGEELPGLKALE